MSRHGKPRPIEPWKIPLLLIWAVIGYILASAVIGGG